MPKAKWNLNTVYISERLQESLRPISRCAMTTMVAPMGYGKTTAVNWYLGERARAEPLHSIRISVYSDNLAIFWKSAQEAFARAGFPFLREYPCPTDAAGGGLLGRQRGKGAVKMKVRRVNEFQHGPSLSVLLFLGTPTLCNVNPAHKVGGIFFQLVTGQLNGAVAAAGGGEHGIEPLQGDV